jgi:hypothetical protein
MFAHLAAVGHETLIFTDDADGLRTLMGAAAISAPSFLIVEVALDGMVNSTWTRDQVARAVESDGGTILVGNRYGATSEQALSRLMASVAGIPYREHNASLPGGNLLTFRTSDGVHCFADRDSTVDHELVESPEYYGCDSLLELEATTTIKHVDLSMTIAPDLAEPGAFVIVVAEPRADSAVRRAFEANMVALRAFVDTLQDDVRIETIPMFREGLPSANSIFIGDTALITLSDLQDDAADQAVLDAFAAALPGWRLRGVSVPEGWGGGLHCWTAMVPRSIFDAFEAIDTSDAGGDDGTVRIDFQTFSAYL